jgi:hypothetical protein
VSREIALERKSFLDANQYACIQLAKLILLGG